jgi:hypothetical protein
MGTGTKHLWISLASSLYYAEVHMEGQPGSTAENRVYEST